MVTFLLLLLLLKAPSGVGNGERVSPSQLTTGSREHRERPPPLAAGSGAELRPKTILVLSGGARTALIAILVANSALLSQGLRLEAEPSPIWM